MLSKIKMDSGTAFQMTDSIIYCIKISQIFNGNVNSSRIDVNCGVVQEKFNCSSINNIVKLQNLPPSLPPFAFICKL